MDAAVHGAPAFMVGPMYRTLGGTGFYNKEFDNLYPLGHHMHPVEARGVQLQRLAQQALQERLPHLDRPDALLRRGDAGRFHPRLYRRPGQPPSQPCAQPADPDGDRVLHPDPHPARAGRGEHGRAAAGPRRLPLLPEPRALPGWRGVPRARTCCSATCPKGSKARIACSDLVSDIDMARNKDPYIVEKHMLLPVVDREVSQGGFHDEWRVYGKPNGDEFFSLRQFELAPGAETVLTGPASLCIIHFSHGREPSAITRLRSSRGFAWASRWTMSSSSPTMRPRPVAACAWSTPAPPNRWWAPAAGDRKPGVTRCRKRLSRPGRQTRPVNRRNGRIGKVQE
jgi:hypothetical protein